MKREEERERERERERGRAPRAGLPLVCKNYPVEKRARGRELLVWSPGLRKTWIGCSANRKEAHSGGQNKPRDDTRRNHLKINKL